MGGIWLRVPENIGVAVEITSIYAAITKLLLLPVLAVISTSRLQNLSSNVGTSIIICWLYIKTKVYSTTVLRSFLPMPN